MQSKIWKPYQLTKKIELKNRIVMAPLTRCFADHHLRPSDLALNYYVKRADAGLIISEATIIEPIGQGYPNTPGIFTKEQISAWGKIVEAIHKAGGLIFLQLWHTGRVSHPIYHSGNLPVSASAIALEGNVPRQKGLQYGKPRPLSTLEVRETIESFTKAAQNAISAGFDGIEIHGANGYLIDQFIHACCNKRNDSYGGSIENRARMPIEIIENISDKLGPDRIGIRLSPGSYYNMTHSDGDEEVFIHLFKKIEEYNLAYVHLGIFDDSMEFDYLGGRASSFIRKHYSGTLISCGKYTIEQAESEINENKIDLAAFGRPFIANPDFINRSKNDLPLLEYDESMLNELI
ncbi:MAG: alkene reductase [Bdellovibrionota bacterium]